MVNEWDEYAKEWDTNSEVVIYSELAFKSLTNFIAIDGFRVFDFGCGTGLLTEKISPFCKQIVALDNSTEMTRVLENKKLQNVTVISDLLTKKLIDSNEALSPKFDLIVASSVCSFLPNYKETLRLLKSLLVKNGIFIQWDWFAKNDDAEFGLSAQTIKDAFAKAELELIKLSEPFTMTHGEETMPVIMAIGKNYT